MHQYLDAIGFKNIFTRESEIEQMLDNLFQSYDNRQAARETIPGCAFLEVSKSYGPGMGIRLCGQMDADGFHRTFYFPYLERSLNSATREVTVDRKGNGEGFYGMIDDGREGVSIIFHLQNPALVMKYGFQSTLSSTKVSVTLTGLSDNGMILLGHKQPAPEEQQLRRADDQERMSLVIAAKGGSEDAAQSLTMADMDTYAMLARRIRTEDIYTIVESSFMPTGLECDLYKVVGTILFYTQVRNALTRQQVYQLTVDCNGIPIDICINREYLLGEPDVGRRFKGNIWLQGRLRLDEETDREETGRLEEVLNQEESVR